MELRLRAIGRELSDFADTASVDLADSALALELASAAADVQLARIRIQRRKEERG